MSEAALVPAYLSNSCFLVVVLHQLHPHCFLLFSSCQVTKHNLKLTTTCTERHCSVSALRLHHRRLILIGSIFSTVCTDKIETSFNFQMEAPHICKFLSKRVSLIEVVELPVRLKYRCECIMKPFDIDDFATFYSNIRITIVGD